MFCSRSQRYGCASTGICTILYGKNQRGINSSFLFYYASQHDPQPQSAVRVDVPVGVALFPRESPATGPREWAEPRYKIVRWTQIPHGGHFPAAEEPELLAAELREFFRQLR